jgi:hypothetical protein
MEIFILLPYNFRTFVRKRNFLSSRDVYNFFLFNSFVVPSFNVDKQVFLEHLRKKATNARILPKCMRDAEKSVYERISNWLREFSAQFT